MKWLRLSEASEYAAISVKRLRVLVKAGKIPAKVDGRLIKISQTDIEKYMESLPTVAEALKMRLI